MIDIVDFFKQQVELWNTENKCGFCWEFEAPLRESDVNESEKKNEECCVRVFLTNLSIRENRQYDRESTYIMRHGRDYSFDLHVVMYDRIDINVYQEQAYPLTVSKWVTILKPIRECLQCLDFCEILGRQMWVVNENWTTKIDWLDNNYTGWTVNMTLRDLNIDNC